MTQKRTMIATFSLAAFLLIPAIAVAEVENGDFESGGASWGTSVPSDWSVGFPSTGGNPNGNGRITSADKKSVGYGVIYQDIKCGDPSDNTFCTISFDYRIQRINADNAAGAWIFLTVDGDKVYVSPAGATPGTAYVHVSVNVKCGDHKIDLGLEVIKNNNGDEDEEWRARFDNVTAVCEGPTPVENSTWGRIKTIYR